ncbi:MAG TPA: hypothetical protein VER32_00490, partial [Pyrinomonadaceae bacterium]|nr:hypothetical protein [Pyrinomonadaceae bacterium]
MNKPDETRGAGRETEEIASASQPSHYNTDKNATGDEGAHGGGGARDAHDDGAPDSDDVARRRGGARAGVSAETPEEFTGGLEVKRPAGAAGGMGAVWSSAKHAWREMGLARSVRTLARVNQKDGFDCPGCAWPDPDGERSHFEY